MKQHYLGAFITALTLHLVLIALLFLNMKAPVRTHSVAAKKETVKIVRAVTVDQQQVVAEIKRIQVQRKQEKEQQQRLQRQAQAAIAKRKQEQQRLQRIKNELKQVERQRLAQKRAAEKKLAQIKQQQLAEKKRLKAIQQQKTALKVKQQQEVKRLADIAEKQRQAEVARQKAQQQADAKRQAEEVIRQAALQKDIDKYKALVTSAIQNHWNYPDNVSEDLSCRLRIRVAPGGAVLDVKVIQSSGHTLLDRSAQMAVYKASPLPVPTQSELFEQFRVLNLRVQPQGKIES